MPISNDDRGHNGGHYRDSSRPHSPGPLGGRQLRLLWIMPFWPTPSNPTALTPAREVAILLARAGHCVVLLGMSDEAPEPTLPRHPNLIDDPLIVPGDGPIRQARGAREILRRARRYHAESPFDLAFVRFAHPIGVTATIVSQALRIPLVYQEEAPDITRVTQRRIERVSMRAMKHCAAMRLASGPTIAQEVEALLQRPVYPIPLAVDVDRFRVPLSRKLDPGDDVRLLAVGRLHEQKGTNTLIEAFGRLPRRFHLDLVGDGDARHEAEARIAALGAADRVTFWGMQPPTAIPDFLSKAHLFVLPSNVESFCVAAAEALSAGLPCVVTRSGGPEYFVGPDDGLVVEPRDPAALTDAILAAIDSYDTFNPVEIADRARARFGPAAAIELYETMFATTLGIAPMPEPGPFGPFWFR